MKDTKCSACILGPLCGRHELAELDPGKPFPDMIEGLFGAVFIDSKGDLTQCESLVNRIGVFSSLHWMTRNSIDVVHLKRCYGVVTR